MPLMVKTQADTITLQLIWRLDAVNWRMMQEKGKPNG